MQVEDSSALPLLFRRWKLHPSFMYSLCVAHWFLMVPSADTGKTVGIQYKEFQMARAKYSTQLY